MNGRCRSDWVRRDGQRARGLDGRVARGVEILLVWARRSRAPRQARPDGTQTIRARNVRKVPHPAFALRMTSFALIVIALCACGPAPSPATAPSPVPATPTPAPEQRLAREAWQKSPHANTYDEGKGPNTYCARCHSPLNWDPKAVVDPAPNCVSCKFAFDPQMRVATGNPPVAREAWRDIGCEICHVVKDGAASATPTWLDTRTGYHETVADSTELCAKCHTDTATIRHARDLGMETHEQFACTACHDAHSTAASCAAAGCHPATAGSAPGHDSAHAKVTCGACHDAAKLEAGPLPDGSAWVTFRTTELLGRKTKTAYASHNLQRAVDCARCHYASNPWKLPVQGVKTQ